MVSISPAVRRVKEDLTRLCSPQLIEQHCNDLQYTWRHRQLGPVVTVWLLLQQVLYGNTACAALRLVCGMNVTASAYCQARKRLPLALLRRLLPSTADAARAQTDWLWHDHRTFHIDGSNFSMPHTQELDAHFGHPSNQKFGCSFPVAHLLAMFDAATGMILHLIASPMNTHDQKHAALMHEFLEAGDVLVADRGFCSYVHLALLLQRQMHAVFRVHQRQIVNFKPHRKYNRPGRKRVKGRPNSQWLRRLGAQDQMVRWCKPKARPVWMGRADFDALPDSIIVRELRYRVSCKGFRTREVTLVTTLVDAERYSKQELSSLYERRWQAEVNLRHLKTTMGMETLKCRTVEGVMKELYAFVIVYNLVCRVMVFSASKRAVAVDRISFIDALRWLQHASPGDEPPPLQTNPRRRGRYEPRVVKRRPKKYKLMKTPRTKLRKALELQHVMA